jgi:hypothetical protein
MGHTRGPRRSDGLTDRRPVLLHCTTSSADEHVLLYCCTADEHVQYCWTVRARHRGIGTPAHPSHTRELQLRRPSDSRQIRVARRAPEAFHLHRPNPSRAPRVTYLGVALDQRVHVCPPRHVQRRLAWCTHTHTLIRPHPHPHARTRLRTRTRMHAHAPRPAPSGLVHAKPGVLSSTSTQRRLSTYTRGRQQTSIRAQGALAAAPSLLLACRAASSLLRAPLLHPSWAGPAPSSLRRAHPPHAP